MVGLWYISDMHTSGREKEFSKKYRDDYDNGDYDYYYDDEFITSEGVIPRDICMLWKVKNLLHKEEINKEKL